MICTILGYIGAVFMVIFSFTMFIPYALIGLTLLTFQAINARMWNLVFLNAMSIFGFVLNFSWGYIMSFYTTTQLAKFLGLDIDALTTKDFGDTSGASVGKEILFTGYEIYTHAELVEMYNKQAAREQYSALMSEAAQA